MPKDFERCVDKGGRVRRIVPKKGRYINVCYDDKGSHSGEAHKTKSKNKREGK